MTYNEIKKICKKYKIKNWSINNLTGLVDVDGNVGLYSNNLTELPLNFGNVSGSFWCDFNELTTLKGAPISVGGYFNCSRNNLTSIEYCPISIYKWFVCDGNNISTRQKIPNTGDEIYYDKTMKWLF